MSDQPEPYVPIADVEVNVVRPVKSGFILDGQGADGADYRLEMQLDMPVDSRTRTVLGELLAQSEWRVARRVVRPFPRRSTRRAGRPEAQ